MFAKIGGIDLATFMLLSLPYSRKHEKEADVLGLDIMVPTYLSFTDFVPRGGPSTLAGWLAGRLAGCWPALLPGYARMLTAALYCIPCGGLLVLCVQVRACVDPLIATKVWEKMAQRGAHAHDHESSRQKKQQQQQPPKSQNQKQQKRPAQMPTILSTHPHDETRAKYLGELAPEKAGERQNRHFYLAIL